MKKQIIFIPLMLSILFISGEMRAQFWKQKHRGQINKIDHGNYLGWSVAMDSQRLIIGSHNEGWDSLDKNKLNGAGAAYIYIKDTSGQWVLEQKICASDRKIAQSFGLTVDIHKKIITVGVPFESRDSSGQNILNNAGAVYVFEMDSTGKWKQSAKLCAPDRAEMDQFGTNVKLDGQQIIISAPSQSYNESGSDSVNNAGAIYIYHKNSHGYWSFSQKIVANTRLSHAYLGERLSLSGNILAASAFQEDFDTTGSSTLINSGSIYVFERDTQAIWHIVKKINSPNRLNYGQFGNEISIYKNILLAASSGDGFDSIQNNNITGAGSVYVFERQSDSSWKFIQKICAPIRKNYQLFGSWIEKNDDWILIGMTGDDADAQWTNLRAQAGSILVYKKNASGFWTFHHKILINDRDGTDKMGFTFDVFKNQLVAGAPYKDEISGPNVYQQAGVWYTFETCIPSIQKLDITACSTYISPSKKYHFSSSGKYYDTLISVDGCDSIFEIELVLNNSQAKIKIESCAPVKSPSGKYTWSTNGLYSDTIKNYLGCDSLITADIKLLNSKNSISISACPPWISPSGKYAYRNSGAYIDTLVNAQGCDSLITIQFVSLQKLTLLNIDICDTFFMPSGKGFITQSGKYYDTLISASGCDSILELKLNKVILNTSITQSGNMLTSLQPLGSWQWLDCSSGLVIPGATLKTFAPQKSGNYAVIVSDKGCRDTSSCKAIQLSLAENPMAFINIFPNPASEMLYIHGAPLNAQYTIFDMHGKHIKSGNVVYGNVEISINSFDWGLYHIQIIHQTGSTYNYSFLKL